MFACASAPHQSSIRLNPEAGKDSLTEQDLDYVYNVAISTGTELGYKVVSSSKEERTVAFNRIRTADLVSETIKVDIEKKGGAADANIVYESPKPLADITVKEFTDRFLANLKAKPASKSSAAGSGGSQPKSTGAQDVGGDTSATTYMTLLKNGNVRVEPSTKSKIIRTLKKGEKVAKVDESGNWVKVRLASGETGWVFKSLLKETK